MRLDIQMKIGQNPKAIQFLQTNSEWYKYLNRNPLNYEKFNKSLKEQNRIKTTNKVSEMVENIDLVSNILNVIK